MRRATLVYDSDCGPCTTFKRAVCFLDSYGHLDFSSLISADSLGLLDDVPPNRRHRSFHVVYGDGTVRSGAEAISGLVRELPSGSLLSPFIGAPLVSGSVKMLYSAFARRHDAGSCEYKPGSPVSRTKMPDEVPASIIGTLI